MVESGMPEVRAIHIERLLAIRQEVPRISRQVDVHLTLWHYPLWFVENWHVAFLVSDSLHLVEIVLKIALQEIMQGIDSLVEKDDVDTIES